jgi:hypothetical protein
MDEQIDGMEEEMRKYVATERILQAGYGWGPGKILHANLRELAANARAANANGVQEILVSHSSRFLRPQAYDRWTNRNAAYGSAELRSLQALGVPLVRLDLNLKEDGPDGWHSKATTRTGKHGRPRKGAAQDEPDGETYAEKIFKKVIAIEIDPGTGKIKRWNPTLRELKQWCEKNIGGIGLATLSELPKTPSPWGPLWEEIFEAERQDRVREYGGEIRWWLPDEAIIRQRNLVRNP